MRGGKSVFIVAGEPSGDLHGSRLLRELLHMQPDLKAAGIGGRHLGSAGMDLLEDLAADAVMGFFPVLRALPRLRRVFRRCLERLDTQRPDLLLLVDYPGFNLRLAAEAERRGIPVIWYIPPKVWAWKRGRIKEIKRCVRKVLVILPFEEEVYREADIDVQYVGSPVVDHWAEHVPSPDVLLQLRQGGARVLGLFPGSRRHVQESLLGTFIDAAARCRDAGTPWRVVVSGNADVRAMLQPLAERAGLDAVVHTGPALDIMHAMDAGLAASGTVTLELALAGKPFAIAYRVSAPVFLAGKMLINLPHYAPVNLVAEREVAREFIGVRSPAGALALELQRLQGAAAAREMQHGLAEVRRRLGPPGASRRAARCVHEFLDGA